MLGSVAWPHTKMLSAVVSSCGDISFDTFRTKGGSPEGLDDHPSCTRNKLIAPTDAQAEVVAAIHANPVHKRRQRGKRGGQCKRV